MFEKLRDVLHRFEEGITTKTLNEKDISEALSQLELNLLESEVALEAVTYIVDSLKKRLVGLKVDRGQDMSEIVKATLKETLSELFSAANQIDMISTIEKKRVSGSGPSTILFLGINGTGKTTTIAKLSHLLNKHGFGVVMAASDTYRAGAIEQLEIHSQRIGIKLLKQRYGSDPAAVARDAKGYAIQHHYDVVLIDTAGRMQTSTNLMEELAKIKRVSSPDLTVFVGDSLAGNDLIAQAREFLDKVGFDAIILTKTDADVKGGATISITFATKRPIAYIGTGQAYDDLVRFEPNWIISRILN